MHSNKIILKSTNFLLVLFILFTVIPVNLNYSSIVIIVLFFLAVLNLFVQKNKEYFKRNSYLFILCIPLVIYALGLINTSNLDYGVSFLLKNLSFIAFPFIIFSLRSYITEEKLFKAFLLGLTGVNLYLIYLFFYYFNFGTKFYMVVTTDIYHSTYLGMYNLFAYWICIMFFNKKSSKLYAFLSLFFLLSAILCSARIIFVLSIISICIAILLMIKSNTKRIAAISLVSIFGFILLVTVPSIKQKFNQFTEIQELGFDRHNYQSISSRFGKIEASLKVVKKNFLFGTGTGDIIDDLVKEYEEMNFVMGYKYRYNPHNQYLDNLVRNGIIGGGISLLVIFILPFYISIHKKNMILMSFILILTGVSLTESILNVHKGITFYTFFVTLMISQSIQGKENHLS